MSLRTLSLALFLLAARPMLAATIVMQAWSGSDGPFNTISMDGNTLYQGQDQGGGNYSGFMYFRRPSGSFTAGATLYMEVDYKDLGGPGSLGVQYNAVGNAFQSSGMVLNASVQNTGGYKTAVMRLDSASFSFSENGGNDLRLTRTQNLQFYIKEVRVSDTPGAAYLAATAFMGPYTGPSFAGADLVDSSTLIGKMLVGYQGWFRTPNDDDDVNWQHWTRSWGSMAAGLISEDFWPQMDEFTAAERHAATGYTYPGGAQAELFSSDNARTVLRHFQWMEAYGIDGAGVQRFTNGLASPGADGYRVLSHVRAAANQTGRTYFVEYDMTGTPENQLVTNIANDWHTLVDSLQLNADGRYLKQGGLPVVGVYGFFADRFSPATANAILDIFQTGPAKYRAFVAGAGAWYWRTDSATTPAWQTMLYRLGSWQPWNCGNYLGSMPNISANSSYWAADKADFAAHGVIYIPEIYPGGSSANRDGLPPGSSDMPRQGGDFLWRQFVDAYNLGAQSLFLGMFDELDEGTQILKVTENYPTQSTFKAYEGMPSDCYLCFAGLGSKMMKGQIAFTTARPNCPGLTQPSIPEPAGPLSGAVVAGPAVSYSWAAALALPGGGSLSGYQVLLDGVTVSAAALSQIIATTPGNHVWRVRAVNSLGNASGWSLPQSFTATGPTPTPTFTRTRTNSPTPSASPTATPSVTPSASSSRTRTPTLSMTPTTTPSNTPAASPTWSATPSPTVTATATVTLTRTPPSSPTPSATRTAASTASATPSRSATPSHSPTGSATPSITVTVPGTSTHTPTATASCTPSASVTPSRSPTNTATPSATRTASATSSGTPSRTPSASATPSWTPSASPSESPTGSATRTVTAGPSSTPTATSSQSPTSSASSSASVTFSATPSRSPTASRTAVATASVTLTPTATHTKLPTASASPTPSFSASPTPVSTATPSSTPTPLPTGTLTVTLTRTQVPAATATELPVDVYARVLAVVAVPNPDPTSLSVQLRGRSRKLRVQVYTVNMRKVVDEELGPQGPDWVSVPLPADFLREAGNGTYYARVWTEDQRQAVLARLVFIH